VLKPLLENHFDKIHGLIHCSGGGQTKCLKYLPGNFKIIKDNLFKAPPIFDLIQESSGSSLREMYEVFNMGCRLEIYCKPEDASIMMEAANNLNIDAQIIGRVEAGEKKELVIKVKGEEIIF
jgi:phosphoribosylformylglycinamidine cyclo-ligase